jgi:hypothetical protein
VAGAEGGEGSACCAACAAEAECVEWLGAARSPLPQ